MADSATTTITSKGSDYDAADSGVNTPGLYGEAGVEILPFKKVGLKAAMRYTMHTTGDIGAMDSRKIRFEQVYGYVALMQAL
jgi:hypothetical protein